MQHFQFFTPRSIEEALEYLYDKGDRCKIIAGGTDLIPSLRREDICPDFVMNILEIPELRGIEEIDDIIKIGPTTTFTEMLESDTLFRYFPSLLQSAASIGSPQIRNRGTIGGNIANGSPAADALPALLAHDVELELQSRGGRRRIKISEAIEAPYRTRFRPEEMLTGIFIKRLESKTRERFEKLGRRNSMARARMNLTVILRLGDRGEISDIRIVPGAVMPVARRMKETEEMLIGENLTPSLLEASSERLSQEVVGITGIRWSTEYKLPVLKNIFKRIMNELGKT